MQKQHQKIQQPLLKNMLVCAHGKAIHHGLEGGKEGKSTGFTVEILTYLLNTQFMHLKLLRKLSHY